jgi:hypothetical protein
MSWSTKIWKPIKLKDGRSIETLADARAIMLALPELHQRNPHWQYAAELLLSASNSKSAVDDATAQLLRALKAEGLVQGVRHE